MASEYPHAHKLARVSAVIAALEEAFISADQGLESIPFHDYTFENRPQWSSWFQRDKLVSYLESEFVDELAKNKGHWHMRQIHSTPALTRLDYNGRLLLAQRLDMALSIPEDELNIYYKETPITAAAESRE